jgi:putative transposase
MFTRGLRHVARTGRAVLRTFHRRLIAATKPSAATILTRTLTDLARSKPELITENAFLRQQLVVLARGVKRPRCTPADRAVLVLLASRVRRWRQALLIVQPDTLLRWHRQVFRHCAGSYIRGVPRWR